MRFLLTATLLLSLAGPASADPAFDPQELRERLAQCPSAVRILDEMKANYAIAKSQVSQLSGVPRLRVACDGMQALTNGYQHLYGALRACQGQHALGLEPIVKVVADMRIKTGQQHSQDCD